MSESTDREFARVLSALEEALETPVIPGEFERWTQTVREQAIIVDRMFQKEVVPEKTALLQEMENIDVELLSRVESLHRDQNKLQDSLRAFIVLAKKAISQAEQREHSEGGVETLAERVVQEGLKLVISLRKHALAVTTWFNEAALRDRGIQD